MYVCEIEKKKDGTKGRKRENEERCDYQTKNLADNDCKGKSVSAGDDSIGKNSLKLAVESACIVNLEAH